MMPKILFGSIAFFLLLPFGYAQRQGGDRSLKLYLQTQYDAYRISGNAGNNTVVDSTSRFLLGGFSPAIAFEKENGNFHELALVHFRMSVEDRLRQETPQGGGPTQLNAGLSQSLLQLSLRYEYAINLLPEKERLRIFVGFAMQPYFQRKDEQPRVSTDFRQSESRLGVRLQTIPRIQWQGKGRFFADFNLIASWVDFTYIRNRVDDPTLFQRQQVLEGSTATWFPIYLEARLGLGIRM